MSFQLLGLILFTVTLSACAQLAMKVGVTRAALANALEQGLSAGVSAAIMSPLIWVGLLIYAFSAALWLWVLAKAELSVAYPFVGISFIVTAGFGAFFLGENLTLGRVVGVLLIAAGCVLVGKSA